MIVAVLQGIETLSRCFRCAAARWNGTEGMLLCNHDSMPERANERYSDVGEAGKSLQD
jgi:hypothetical protein